MPVAVAAQIPEFAPAGRASAGRRVRRRISQPAGRALEILGHAIEYLTDEHIHSGGSLLAPNPQVEAIQLLMALNREIYFECPEAPSLKSRMSAFLHPREA